MHALFEDEFTITAGIAIRRSTRSESTIHDDDPVCAPALIKLLFCLHHFFLVGPLGPPSPDMHGPLYVVM
jgi:hypothetical protein